MLARADSQGIQSLPAATPPSFPAWARPVNAPETEAEAAFLAGAALARLDAIVREKPSWAGVFRRRLALSAAAASVRGAGRTEDEAALRDAFHLRRPGADPGPAGKRLLAWRELSARSAAHWRSSFYAAAEVLAVSRDEALQQAIDAAEACAAGNRPAPFAAAQVFGLARARSDSRRRAPGAWRPGRGGRTAGGLARRRGAGAAPQLAVRASLARRGIIPGRGKAPGGLENPADGAEGAIVFAYAKTAARACDLSAELGRRAQKLQDAAPKLRAKGAGAALEALLDDDSLSASSKIGGQMSERGARRLFDRLAALGAIRELTGRATFRLYGL